VVIVPPCVSYTFTTWGSVMAALLKLLRLFHADGQYSEEHSVCSVRLGDDVLFWEVGEDGKLPMRMTRAEWDLFEARQGQQQIDFLKGLRDDHEVAWDDAAGRDLLEGITPRPAFEKGVMVEYQRKADRLAD
jgi:hypothetical protein